MTYGHLRADCLYIRISSGPNARYRVWESLLMVFTGDDAVEVVLHQAELPDVILALFVGDAPDVVNALRAHRCCVRCLG